MRNLSERITSLNSSDADWAAKNNGLSISNRDSGMEAKKFEQLNRNTVREIFSGAEVEDFSLVLGGPLFQLLRKSHLEGDVADLLTRRIVVFICITWLPLLLLSFAGSTANNHALISFFRDIEVHARFLVSLPILIAAELVVHVRMRPVVRRFLDWRIIRPEDRPIFQRAIESAVKLRNSTTLELALLVAVYTLGLWAWNEKVQPDVISWYRVSGHWNLTRAGYWYVFVSIPIFQFILLRWYMRLFVWFRFLWQLNRIDLNLIPTHPDRCAGLSFVGKSSYAYAPILFAQGAILAGLVANRVLYGGEHLQSFKFQIAGFIVFFVFFVLAPLLMFTPRMANVRRQGLADYGSFAQRYVENFDQKWLRAPVSEELLGTGDIQSLADLANSYQVIREMNIVPFGLQDISRLAIATAAPLAPLLLTVFSLEELVVRALKAVF
jgi:hypothetical protein